MSKLPYGTYGMLFTTFWTGESGKRIRGKTLAQLVGAYLFSAPLSNMIGLYYVPLSAICHDLGCSHKSLNTALDELRKADIAIYDHLTETVFVKTMAARRLSLAPGELISDSDAKRKCIPRMLRQLPKTPLLKDFLDEYRIILRLENMYDEDGQAISTTPPADGQEAPSRPPQGPRPQEQDQDPNQDPDQEQDQHQEQPRIANAQQAAVGAVPPIPKKEPPPEPIKPKRGRPPKSPLTDEQEGKRRTVVACWCALFEQHKNVPPIITDKDMGQIRRLLESMQWNEARVCGLIEVAFQDRTWILRGPNLGDILANPNRFNQGILAKGYGPGLKPASPQQSLNFADKPEGQKHEGENPEARAAYEAARLAGNSEEGI